MPDLSSDSAGHAITDGDRAAHPAAPTVACVHLQVQLMFEISEGVGSRLLSERNRPHPSPHSEGKGGTIL